MAVGALKPLKSYDILLRALSVLAAEGKQFELLLAGKGSDRERLQGLACELGLAECVTFLGEVADVPALLASAHLLVHTAMSEGLGNTVLEAMGEGLPVVATSVGGTPEVIEDGLSGLLIPPGDVPAFVDALRRLLDDAELRRQLGRGAAISSTLPGRRYHRRTI